MRRGRRAVRGGIRRRPSPPPIPGPPPLTPRRHGQARGHVYSTPSAAHPGLATRIDAVIGGMGTNQGWPRRTSSSAGPASTTSATSTSTCRANKLIVFTGVSGSGKCSLAFDTLYAEGQRRYVESLSSYARQFLGQLPKPDVDYIGGLSPVDLHPAEDRRAATRARPSARSPRSTTSCASCTPASARGTARSAAGRSPPRPASRSSPASSALPEGTRFLGAGPGGPRAEGRVQGLLRRHAASAATSGPGSTARSSG